MLRQNDRHWAEFWNRQNTGLHHSNNPTYFAWLSAELKLLLPDVSSRSVLDIGCGCGELYTYLGFDKARSYRGVDLSNLMLEKFRERFAGTDLVCSPADAYLSEQKYDLIFSNAVVQYLNRTQLSGLVGNASKMLAARGFIVLGMIPWLPMKRPYHAGDLVTEVSSLTRAVRVLKTLIRDRMGYWYAWNDIRRIAAANGLDPFFYGSLTDPYRFHVVMTRLADFDDDQDETLRRYLASRRS